MVVPNRHVATLAATTPDELAELMRLTRHAEMALTEAYTPQGINVGINLGRPAGAGIARSPARAPRAALERRHQLHVRRRQHARAAGGSGADGGAAAADLRAPRRDDVEPQSAQSTQRQDHGLCVSACLRGSCHAMILELTPEQKAFKQSIEQFAREVVAPRAAAIDKSGEFPADVMHAAAGHGLLGVTIPKAWGGAGPRLRQLRAGDRGDRAGERHGRGRRSSVTNSLVAELIAHAGTRRSSASAGCGRWRRGEAIGAFALSEPDAGTDAANQQTTAVATGDGYRITGRKVWVANAEDAAVAIVFARTRPGLRGQGVTAFLVPMDTPGITRTARADSLGVRGLGCMDLELDIDGRATIRCSATSIRDSALAMWALQGGRVAIAAQALGIGEAALDEAIAYAKQREQFGQPIANYQAIQWMLADMATELAAARMLTEGRGREGPPGAEHASRRRWRSWRRRKRRTRPPTRRCRFSRRPATAAARSSSGCSATSARRRSIRARPKRSG